VNSVSLTILRLAYIFIHGSVFILDHDFFTVIINFTSVSQYCYIRLLANIWERFKNANKNESNKLIINFILFQVCNTKNQCERYGWLEKWSSCLLFAPPSNQSFYFMYCV